MKRLFLIISAVAALVSLAVLSAALAATNSQTGARVSAANSSLGRIIVDGRGRTLYLFEKDKRGHSTCSGACATYWPPVITHGKPIAGPGCAELAARHDPAGKRLPTGHLPGDIRYTGRPGHQARSDQWGRLAGLRCRLGRALARRKEDRGGRRRLSKPHPPNLAGSALANTMACQVR